MEALIILTTDDALILLKDGSIASVHYNGDQMILEMYQQRIKAPVNKYIWEELETFTTYIKEFPYQEQVNDEIIQYAFNWLAPNEAIHKVSYIGLPEMQVKPINQFLNPEL